MGVKGGWVELNIGEIIYASTRSIGHCQTIASGHARVGCLFPKSSNTPRSQHNRIRFQRDDLIRRLVKTPGPSNTLRGLSVHTLNQVDGQCVGPQRNTIVLFCIGGQCSLDFFPSGVFCVENPL